MAFKMKGSAFKLNNVATKSALKQKVDHASTHGGAEDKKYDLLSAEGNYDFVGGSLPSANVVTHKKGNYLNYEKIFYSRRIQYIIDCLKRSFC